MFREWGLLPLVDDNVSTCQSMQFVGPGRILDNILEDGLHYYLFYTHNAKHVLSDHITSGHYKASTYLYRFPHSCEIFWNLQMFVT